MTPRITVIDTDREFLVSLAQALTAAGAYTVGLSETRLSAVFRSVSAAPPDLAFIGQPAASPDLIDVLRRHGPPHLQVILLLDHAGPPPPALMYHTNGYIWRDVGFDRLADHAKRSLRVRQSIARMRAVKVST